MPARQLSHEQKALLAELGGDEILDVIYHRVHERFFIAFTKADDAERLEIGRRCDVLEAVRAEFQRTINEVASDGRIESIR